jgi:hypothetical protein
MGVLDKVRKFKNSRPKGGNNNTRMVGIFHDWEQGSNHIRLVGEFIQVQTHFIAPAPKRSERGLCQEETFDRDNENAISKVVNCPDWDVENEQPHSKKTCPVCKLYRIALDALDELKEEEKNAPENEDPEAAKARKKEIDYFTHLKGLARPRTNLKWNIFDREKPDVRIIDENGNETKQKGLKIASIGMEAWDDIEGIFEQCGFDITDPQEGIDINVIKGHNGTRTAYSSQAVIEGTGLKQTPFDDEEAELAKNPHDLLAFCGKHTDADKIRDGLHGDYAELLDLNDDGDEPAPPKKSAVPKTPKAVVTEDDDLDDDDDMPLGGSQKKK